MDARSPAGERSIEADVPLARADVDAALDPDPAGPADARYGQAVDLAQALGMRPVVAQALLGRGRLRQRAGDAERGRADLAAATRMLRELDMRFWLGHADPAA